MKSPLTPADKAFLAATLSMDEKRDRKEVLAAYKTAYGEAVADKPDKALWYRIRQLGRHDDAKAYQLDLRVTAGMAQGQGVAEQNKAVFKKQAALEDLERAMIEGLRDILDNVDESGASRAKAAEAAVKVLARQANRPPVDPAIVAARSARKAQARADLEASRRAQQAPDGVVQDIPDMPAVSTRTEAIGRA